MPWLSLLAEVLAIVLSAVILGAVAWLRRSLASLSAAQEEQSERFDRRLGAVEREIVKVKDIERHEVIERVGALEVKLARLEDIERQDVVRRLGVAEVSLAGLAKADDISRIHVRVDELSKEVHSLAGQMASLRALERSVALIHDHLLGREGG